ncbi:MAG: sulfite exporter TauE/SafE family protein [Elusimicrobia bacterium]|nr:sulfite exporter TauE/SafE family protein [Elusimicrobiota bacterium]MDE2510873.1 sulfite exporter TauE/SafE family protein [Elusimicrobiota bacterium]
MRYNARVNDTFLYLLLGLVVGVISGMIGVGGGILIVPALVFFFGFTQLAAQGTSTAMLLPPIGILAVYTYWKAGCVDVRVAALLCAGFVLGGLFGAKLAVALPREVLRRVFGGFLLIVSVKMLSGR